MSYSIDSIHVIAAEGFRIEQHALDALYAAHGEDAPESSIFDSRKRRDIIRGLGPVVATPDVESGPREFYAGSSFQWTGVGSGRAWGVLVTKILPRFSGSADLIVCWEGGDSYTGLRVRDGKVTRHEVVRSLGAETPPSW